MPGVAGQVLDVLALDPDGPGGKPESIIVAGMHLTAAGDQIVLDHALAEFSAGHWHGLGGRRAALRAAAVHDDGTDVGVVVAGWVEGLTLPPVKQGVYRFGPSGWRQLAFEFTDPQSAGLRMVVLGPDIYLLGVAMVDGSVADGIAQYRDGAWTQPGIFVFRGDPSPLLVNDGVVHQGTLVVGGQFGSVDSVPAKSVARLERDGSWTQLGQGLEGVVVALATDGNTIAAAMNPFHGASHNASPLRLWDGSSWTPMGPWSTTQPPSSAGARCLTHAMGSYFAARAVRRSDSPSPQHTISRWTGDHWIDIASTGPALALAHAGGSLIAFQHKPAPRDPLLASVGALGLARYDGLAWSPLTSGFDGPIRALAAHQGSLIAAGAFRATPDSLAALVAHTPLDSTASAWQPLGTGLAPPAHDPSAPQPSIAAVLVHDGTPHVAGRFGLKSNAVPLHRLARLTDNVWTPVGPPLPATLHSALSLQPTSDTLIIAGAPELAPGASVAELVAGAWKPMLGGTSPRTSATHALASFHGNVIAGGDPSPESDVAVARWSGSGWEPLGNSPILGRATALARTEDRLFAAGSFTNLPTAAHATLACTEGLQWHAITGLEGVLRIDALATDGPLLYVGGSFSAIAGRPARNLALLAGSSWLRVGLPTPAIGPAFPDPALSAPGASGSVHALLIHGRSLHAAGDFHAVDAQASSHLASFTIPCPADCDHSRTLDVFDLMCFGNHHAAKRPCADCDNDGSWTVGDFACFLAQFAAGCP